MSDEEFFIGEAVLGNKKTFEKKSNFFLEKGDNFYRILPAVRSLAKDGIWAKYWRIHFVTGAKRKQDGSPVKYPVVCVEKSDYKTKVISQHCPLCEIAYEAQKEYNFLEQSGKASKAELSAFKKNRIQAFEPNGKYYVNAVNSDGKIGVLGLPKTAKDSFEALWDKLKNEESINPIGINGIYVNFIRRVNDAGRTTYSCEAMMVPSKENPRLKGYKEHTIDAAFVEKLKKDSVDLTKVYTPISLEDLQAIGSASNEDRGAIADSVLAKGRIENKQVAALETNIPGTGATGIARIELNTATSQLKVTTPEAPKAAGFTSKAVSEVAAVQPASNSAPDLEDDAEFRAFMERHNK